MESLEAGTMSESEYQVFLNFRGPDTRNEFTDFLYHSLIDAGIRVFRDDEELRVGERIDEALQRAIDNARIYIPIFSPTYASSKWCLRELTHIMGNTKSNGNKEILPIFFKVEPKDVKMKDGLYHSAILNLERENKASTEQVDSWRKALTEVAAIKGQEVKLGNSQAKIIKLLVEEVVVKLKIKQKSVTEHLTGINDLVIEVRNLLEVLSGGVRLIQIYGMGGIGKTTLAKVVFNELSTRFGKCCCFLENVRENSSRTNGLVELQKKLLLEIGNATKLEGMDDTEQLMKMTEGTLRNKKVLIVLDDVDKNEQVEKLVGKGALYSGTRVLITTRNEVVLQSTGPKYKMLPYEMKVMSSDQALQLFSRHAFEKDSPSDDYYDISKEIVYATGRLPLTIEVIGSLLKNKTQELWKEKLNELRKAPPRGVFEVLKISYDALTFEQQQIFLDIACFFIDKKKTNAIYMWKDCELFPLTGIEVLKNKSLIKIGESNEFLMHDQLRDLGRAIVRNENPMNPEKRSRLWIKDEVLDTIKTKKIKNVEAMELQLIPANVSIKSEEIRRFEKLRYLRLLGGTFGGDLMDCFPKLRWIDGIAFGLKCELTNMCLKNVVVLQFSAITGMGDLELWSLIKEAKKLKVLSLRDCNGITRTPDLSGCSTLERLTFSMCCNLKKIDGSIGKLKRLIDLKFHCCPCLKGLPKEIGGLQNLENFSLEECNQIKELPNSLYKCKSLRELRLSKIGPVELTSHIRKLENLEVLWVDTELKGRLPSEIGLLSWQKRRQGNSLQGFTNLQLQIIPPPSNLTNSFELDLYDSYQFLKGGIYGSEKFLKGGICVSNQFMPEFHGSDQFLKGRIYGSDQFLKGGTCVSDQFIIPEFHGSDQVLQGGIYGSDQFLKGGTCVSNQFIVPESHVSDQVLQGGIYGSDQFLKGGCVSNQFIPEFHGSDQVLQGGIYTGDFGRIRRSSNVLNSIYKCKSLRELHLSKIGPVELTGDIRKLENLEVLWVDTNLKGQLPSEIGLLSRLQKLVIKQDNILQGFNLPLQIIPNLSNLTNLVELELDISDRGEERRTYAGDLRWIGRLSKLERLRLHIFHVPPTALASLPRLNQLHLSGLKLHPFMPPLLSSYLRNLSDLKLSYCQMRAIQLDGFFLPNLTKLCVDNCRTLKRFMLSSMRKLKTVSMHDCLALDEIHIAGMLESLEKLQIREFLPLRRFVYVDINWECSLESSLILASRVFNKLRYLYLDFCDMLSIQVVGMSESLEDLLLAGKHLQSLGGLSNLKNLKSLNIFSSPQLRIVEGLDKLKFLNELELTDCGWLESLIDVSTTELPNDCRLYIDRCRKLLGVSGGFFRGTVLGFKRHIRRKSVPAASTDRLMVGHAEGSTAAAAVAAAADPAELVGELELQQQHVAVEGGRGDVEVSSVHFRGQGRGDRDEEDGGRDQKLRYYSRAKRQRR